MIKVKQKQRIFKFLLRVAVAAFVIWVVVYFGLTGFSKAIFSWLERSEVQRRWEISRSKSLPTSFNASKSAAAEDTTCVILMWTPWFGSFNSYWNNRSPNCSHWMGRDSDSSSSSSSSSSTAANTKCIFTHNRDLLSTVNIVIFHGPDILVTDFPAQKASSQLWILYSAESPVNYPYSLNENILALFDYRMDYRLDSAFPITYFEENFVPLFERKVRVPFEKRRPVPIAWIASNCAAKNGRHYFIEELSQHIPIDRYGACLNNKKWPTGLNNIELMSHYKFYLAMENSNCHDYVSEKFVYSLMAGTVPIVDGPRNYSTFAPNEKSFIRVDDFRGAKELAQFLLALADDKQRYQEYLSFRGKKTVTLPRDYISMFQGPRGLHTNYGICRICRLAQVVGVRWRKGEPIFKQHPSRRVFHSSSPRPYDQSIEWLLSEPPLPLQKDLTCMDTWRKGNQRYKSWLWFKLRKFFRLGI